MCTDYFWLRPSERLEKVSPLYPQLTEQGKEEAQKIKDLGEEIARLKKRIEQLQSDLHGNKA